MVSYFFISYYIERFTILPPLQPNPTHEPEEAKASPQLPKKSSPKSEATKKPFKMLLCVTTDEDGVETKTDLINPSPASPSPSSSSTSSKSSQFETRAKVYFYFVLSQS